MKDLLLKTAVNASLAKDRAVTSLQEKVHNKEQGDIVQTIIVIAIFVLICVVVGGLLYNSITEQGSKVSDCIANVNTGSCTQFKK